MIRDSLRRSSHSFFSGIQVPGSRMHRSTGRDLRSRDGFLLSKATRCPPELPLPLTATRIPFSEV